MAYKLLYQDNDIEIRKYPSCRRTIMVRDTVTKHYFIPLPYQIYAGVRNRYNQRLFLTAFANKEDDFIYSTPFNKMEQPICIDVDWHYVIPDRADIGEAIAKYWSTYFYRTKLIERMLKIKDYEQWSKRKRIYVKYGKRSLQTLIERYKYLSTVFPEFTINGLSQRSFWDFKRTHVKV